MTLKFHVNSAVFALVITAATSAVAQERRMAVNEVRAFLENAAFECSVGKHDYTLQFAGTGGGKIDFTYTDRKKHKNGLKQTFRVKGEDITHTRDGKLREFFALADGKLRIARPGESGSVCGKSGS